MARGSYFYYFTFTLGFTLAGNVFAETDKTLSIGLKSRIDEWTVSKEKHSHFNGGKYSEEETIEKKVSKPGVLYGPEFIFSAKKYFIRGFYLQGNSNFSDNRKGQRKNIGIDIGFGTSTAIFAGYRRMETSFSNFSDTNLSDQRFSDTVIGLIVRTYPYKPGFNTNFEMLAGSNAIQNAFNNDRYLEHVIIGEFELNINYRFKTKPIDIALGYGIYLYNKPVDKYSHSPSIVIDKILETEENTMHGITLKMGVRLGDGL